MTRYRAMPKESLTVFKTGLIVAILAWSLVMGDTDDTVYACNYTVESTIDGSAGMVTHQDRVRNGHAIPLSFQKHRLEMRITGIDADKIRIDFPLSEKIDGVWQAIYPEPPGFEAYLGAPNDWAHIDDIMQIKASIICSQFND